MLEGGVVMVLSLYSSCSYIFYHCYLEKEVESLDTISHINSLTQTRGYSIFEKWPAFKEDLKRFQPPGELIFQGYCRIYCRSSNNLSRTIGQSFWWYIANRLSWTIPVFVAFLISKEFSCGFTRTLTQLCEGYDCIVMLL